MQPQSTIKLIAALFVNGGNQWTLGQIQLS